MSSSNRKPENNNDNYDHQDRSLEQSEDNNNYDYQDYSNEEGEEQRPTPDQSNIFEDLDAQFASLELMEIPGNEKDSLDNVLDMLNELSRETKLQNTSYQNQSAERTRTTTHQSDQTKESKTQNSTPVTTVTVNPGTTPSIEAACANLENYFNASTKSDLNLMLLVKSFDAAITTPEGIEKLKTNKALQDRVREVNANIVDIYAHTLTSMIARMFEQFDPTNLDPKKNPIATAAKDIVDYTRYLPEYILDSILSETDKTKRNLLIERYLELAKVLTDRGDFCSAKIVYGALSNNAIMKLVNVETTFNGDSEDNYVGLSTTSYHLHKYLGLIYNNGKVPEKLLMDIERAFKGPKLPNFTRIYQYYEKQIDGVKTTQATVDKYVDLLQVVQDIQKLFTENPHESEKRRADCNLLSQKFLAQLETNLSFTATKGTLAYQKTLLATYQNKEASGEKLTNEEQKALNLAIKNIKDCEDKIAECEQYILDLETAINSGNPEEFDKLLKALEAKVDKFKKDVEKNRNDAAQYIPTELAQTYLSYGDPVDPHTIANDFAAEVLSPPKLLKTVSPQDSHKSLDTLAYEQAKKYVEQDGKEPSNLGKSLPLLAIPQSVENMMANLREIYKEIENLRKQLTNDPDDKLNTDRLTALNDIVFTAMHYSHDPKFVSDYIDKQIRTNPAIHTHHEKSGLNKLKLKRPTKLYRILSKAHNGILKTSIFDKAVYELKKYAEDLEKRTDKRSKEKLEFLNKAIKVLSHDKLDMSRKITFLIKFIEKAKKSGIFSEHSHNLKGLAKKYRGIDTRALQLFDHYLVALRAIATKEDIETSMNAIRDNESQLAHALNQEADAETVLRNAMRDIDVIEILHMNSVTRTSNAKESSPLTSKKDILEKIIRDFEKAKRDAQQTIEYLKESAEFLDPGQYRSEIQNILKKHQALCEEMLKDYASDPAITDLVGRYAELIRVTEENEIFQSAGTDKNKHRFADLIETTILNTSEPDAMSLDRLLVDLRSMADQIETLEVQQASTSESTEPVQEVEDTNDNSASSADANEGEIGFFDRVKQLVNSAIDGAKQLFDSAREGVTQLVTRARNFFVTQPKAQSPTVTVAKTDVVEQELEDIDKDKLDEMKRDAVDIYLEKFNQIITNNDALCRAIVVREGILKNEEPITFEELLESLPEIIEALNNGDTSTYSLKHGELGRWKGELTDLGGKGGGVGLDRETIVEKMKPFEVIRYAVATSVATAAALFGEDDEGNYQGGINQYYDSIMPQPSTRPTKLNKLIVQRQLQRQLEVAADRKLFEERLLTLPKPIIEERLRQQGYSIPENDSVAEQPVTVTEPTSATPLEKTNEPEISTTNAPDGSVNNGADKVADNAVHSDERQQKTEDTAEQPTRGFWAAMTTTMRRVGEAASNFFKTQPRTEGSNVSAADIGKKARKEAQEKRSIALVPDEQEVAPFLTVAMERSEKIYKDQMALTLENPEAMRDAICARKGLRRNAEDIVRFTSEDELERISNAMDEDSSDQISAILEYIEKDRDPNNKDQVYFTYTPVTVDGNAYDLDDPKRWIGELLNAGIDENMIRQMRISDIIRYNAAASSARSHALSSTRASEIFDPNSEERHSSSDKPLDLQIANFTVEHGESPQFDPTIERFELFKKELYKLAKPIIEEDFKARLEERKAEHSQLESHVQQPEVQQPEVVIPESDHLLETTSDNQPNVTHPIVEEHEEVTDKEEDKKESDVPVVELYAEAIPARDVPELQDTNEADAPSLSSSKELNDRQEVNDRFAKLLRDKETLETAKTKPDATAEEKQKADEDLETVNADLKKIETTAQALNKDSTFIRKSVFNWRKLLLGVSNKPDKFLAINCKSSTTTEAKVTLSSPKGQHTKGNMLSAKAYAYNAKIAVEKLRSEFLALEEKKYQAAAAKGEHYTRKQFRVVIGGGANPVIAKAIATYAAVMGYPCTYMDKPTYKPSKFAQLKFKLNLNSMERKLANPNAKTYQYSDVQNENGKPEVKVVRQNKSGSEDPAKKTKKGFGLVGFFSKFSKKGPSNDKNFELELSDMTQDKTAEKKKD